MRPVDLYCDLDGVLADFNSGYERLTGVKLGPRDYEHDWDAEGEKWAVVRATDRFYFNLPPMWDYERLWQGILPFRPTIITGVPKEVDHTENDKVDWVHKYLGADVPVICCRSREKSNFCLPGDVIIDDWAKYRSLWLAAGGHWILHRSAYDSVSRFWGNHSCSFAAQGAMGYGQL